MLRYVIVYGMFDVCSPKQAFIIHILVRTYVHSYILRTTQVGTVLRVIESLEQHVDLQHNEKKEAAEECNRDPFTARARARVSSKPSGGADDECGTGRSAIGHDGGKHKQHILEGETHMEIAVPQDSQKHTTEISQGNRIKSSEEASNPRTRNPIQTSCFDMVVGPGPLGIGVSADGAHGVIVRSINENSQCKGKIECGDRIVKRDGSPLHNTAVRDFVKYLKEQVGVQKTLTVQKRLEESPPPSCAGLGTSKRQATSTQPSINPLSDEAAHSNEGDSSKATFSSFCNNMGDNAMDPKSSQSRTTRMVSKAGNTTSSIDPKSSQSAAIASKAPSIGSSVNSIDPKSSQRSTLVSKAGSSSRSTITSIDPKNGDYCLLEPVTNTEKIAKGTKRTHEATSSVQYDRTSPSDERPGNMQTRAKKRVTLTTASPQPSLVPRRSTRRNKGNPPLRWTPSRINSNPSYEFDEAWIHANAEEGREAEPQTVDQREPNLDHADNDQYHKHTTVISQGNRIKSSEEASNPRNPIQTACFDMVVGPGPLGIVVSADGPHGFIVKSISENSQCEGKIECGDWIVKRDGFPLHNTAVHDFVKYLKEKIDVQKTLAVQKRLEESPPPCTDLGTSKRQATSTQPSTNPLSDEAAHINDFCNNAMDTKSSQSTTIVSKEGSTTSNIDPKSSQSAPQPSLAPRLCLQRSLVLITPLGVGAMARGNHTGGWNGELRPTSICRTRIDSASRMQVSSGNRLQ